MLNKPVSTFITALFIQSCFWFPHAHALDPFNPPEVNLSGIYGTWTLKEAAKQHFITFNKDGSFQGKLYIGGTIADEYEGNWFIKNYYMGNSTLHYTYTKSRLIAAGVKDTDTIELLNDKALWVLTKSGRNEVRRIWFRVKIKN